MSDPCNGANRMRTAWDCAWTSELHANIFCSPTGPQRTHMGAAAPTAFKCRPLAPNSAVLLPLQRGSNGLRVPRRGDGRHRVSQRGAIHSFVLFPPCNKFTAR
ncbi:hypothetical protein TcG_13025 [Trypanosoma cruzi]|nr:hypothetical protein TcG_13025 [Trypanosoma cruzi]